MKTKFYSTILFILSLNVGIIALPFQAQAQESEADEPYYDIIKSAPQDSPQKPIKEDRKSLPPDINSALSQGAQEQKETKNDKASKATIKNTGDKLEKNLKRPLPQKPEKAPKSLNRNEKAPQFK